jgi:hypothetical protein
MPSSGSPRFARPARPLKRVYPGDLAGPAVGATPVVAAPAAFDDLVHRDVLGVLDRAPPRTRFPAESAADPLCAQTRWAPTQHRRSRPPGPGRLGLVDRARKATAQSSTVWCASHSDCRAQLALRGQRADPRCHQKLPRSGRPGRERHCCRGELGLRHQDGIVGRWSGRDPVADVFPLL